ncbi:MAG: hypothetical protein JO035_02250 [Betaproteobacteria bacterium]|nr:hypothetical protein [Betaproteobacteria bacterium]
MRAGLSELRLRRRRLVARAAVQRAELVAAAQPLVRAARFASRVLGVLYLARKVL